VVAPKAAPEASRRKPARQGDLDGLCGLYALINALEQVTAKPPGPALQMRLFASLTEALPAPKLRKALTDGLDGKELIKAARAAFPEHKKALGGVIKVSRPLRRQSFGTNAEFTAALTQLIEPGDVALIINFATPSYAHWTVVEAVEHGSLALRDSLGRKSLPLDRYTVRRGPYRILARETLMLQLHPSKRVKRLEDDPCAQ
jgi:hypothetical protein